MRRILIQPTIGTFDSYKTYADKEGFHFEIVDFAFPGAVNKDTSALVAGYKRKLQGNTKYLSMHGVFIDIYVNSPDDTIKEASKKRIVDNLNIAKYLGISSIVFHTNALPMMKQGYYDNWIEMHTAFWKEIIERFDITILLENMWDKHPRFIKQLIEKVGSDKLKCCFDTGHCHVFSQSLMEEWLRELGPHITYMHLNDNDGKSDLEQSPGEGSINWKEFNTYVKRYCDEPDIVLELKDLDMIQKSIHFLKENKIYPFDQ